MTPRTFPRSLEASVAVDDISSLDLAVHDVQMAECEFMHAIVGARSVDEALELRRRLGRLIFELTAIEMSALERATALNNR